MNAPIKLAQATTSGAAEVRIVRLEKPGDGKAVLIQLSTNQTIKVDFSGIAKEKIIIVRVGERAVILFENGATITLDPFWDSLHRPLANLQIEAVPGEIITPAEFALLFPTTTDQSILPTAGEGNDPQEAGANFSDPTIDPIFTPPPLDLLPPTEIPPIEFLREVGPALDDDLIPTQSKEVVGGIVEEEHLVLHEVRSPTQLSDGNEDTDDLNGADTDEFPPLFLNNITITFIGNDANDQNLEDLINSGNPPFDFTFNDVSGQPVLYTGGAPVFSQGDQIFYHKIDDKTLIGFADENGNGAFNGAINDDGTYGAGPDRIVFVVTLDEGGEDGAWKIEIYDQFDHPWLDGLPGDDLENLSFLNLTSTLHAEDADNDPLDFTGEAWTVGVIDDIPIVLHHKDIRFVNEDDIATGDGDPTGSQGTSPNDGDFDGSFTGDPGDGNPGPATIFGSLTDTVKVGADEHPDTEFNTSGLVFSFLEGDAAAAALLALNGLGLSSKGDGIVFSFDLSGDLVGQAGGRLVMKLILESDGDYSFELHDQVDHDPPYDDFFDFPILPGDSFPEADQNLDLQDGVFGDVVFLDFGALIQAEDYDHDAVVLDNKLLVSIVDDIPELKHHAEICLTVDEDDINNFNPGFPGDDSGIQGSTGTSPNDGDGDGSETGNPPVNDFGPAIVSGSLTGVVVESGADEPLTYSFINAEAAQTYFEGLGLRSKGQLLSFQIDTVTGEIIGFDQVGSNGTGFNTFDPADGDRLVFKFTLESDGDFTFELFDQLDHDAPFDDPGDGSGIADQNFDLQDIIPGDLTSIDFGHVIQATDYDGDSVVLEDKVNIKVRDDVPELVGKDCLDAGTHCTGANPDDLLYEIPANASLTIDIDNMIEQAGFENSLGYYFADENGDPISGAILSVNAGAPDGDGNVLPLVISPADIPASAKLIGFFIIPDGNNENPGLNDGDQITFQEIGGEWVAFLNGNPLDTAGDDGVLFSDRRLNPDISPDGNSTPGDDFETGTGPRDSNWEDVVDDSDLDFNDLSFDVKVCATPVVFAIVDEDDIDTGAPTGSDGTSPNDGNADGSFTGGNGAAFVTGTLTGLVESGTDEDLTYRFVQDAGDIRTYLESLGLRSKGEALSYEIDLGAGTIIAFDQVGAGNGSGFTDFDQGAGDRRVFQLTLDSNGDWIFELYDQVDHDPPYDTDPAGFISADDPNYVDNNGHANTPTADQNTDLIDRDDDNTPPGEPRVFDVDTLDFGAIIEAVDFDGDAVLLDDRFLIQIRDDIPKLKDVAAIVKTVDEDDIDTANSKGTSVDDGTGDGSSTGPNPPENGDSVGFDGPAIVSGSLTGLAESGTDEPLTYRFIDSDDARDFLEGLGLRSQGSLLSYDLDTSGLIQGFINAGGPGGTSYDPPADRLVFQLTVNANGTYTFELHDQLDHDLPFDDPGDGSGNADQNFDLQDSVPGDLSQIAFGQIIEAVDFDDDSVLLGNQFKIQIRDDVPDAKLAIDHEDTVLTVDETAGNQGDEPGTPAVFNALQLAGNIGVDAAMTPQYATDTNLLLNTGSVIGADEPANPSLSGFSLSLTGSEPLASGLFTSGAGPNTPPVERQIFLFVESHGGQTYIVGRYDDNIPPDGVAENSDPAAFALYIDPVTGALHLAQYVSLENPIPGNTNEPLFLPSGLVNANYTLVDFDGDKDVATVDLGDNVRFLDDAPTLGSGSASFTVDEDDIDTLAGAAGSHGTSPDDGNADGSFTGNTGVEDGDQAGNEGPAVVTGSVAGLVFSGADNPVTFGFVSEASILAALNPLGLTSKDGVISYDLQGSTLFGFVNGGGTSGFEPANDRLVFQFTMNSNGTFEFQLHDQFDHDPPGDDAPTDGVSSTTGSEENFDLQDSLPASDVSSINFGALIQATDADGDSVTLNNLVNVSVHDDVPVVTGEICPIVQEPQDGGKANIVFVLDTSGSMDEMISFDGGLITRLQALQNAMNEAIDALAASGADDVRIHIVQFNESAGPGITFDLIVGGVLQTGQVTAAHDIVNGLDDTFDDDSTTNYEAGLQQVINWLNGGTSTNTVNGSEDFDGNTGAGNDPTYLLDSYGTKVAIVSAWNGTGTDQQNVTGNLTDGWGVDTDPPGGDSTDITTGEMLRFDFGEEDTFGVAGYDPSPAESATEFATFHGPAVEFATFRFVNWQSTEFVDVVVHYTDLTTQNILINNFVSNAIDTRTFGTDGKLIAYIEFEPTVGGGTIDLEEIVVQHTGPIPTADVDKVIFVSDGEPNRALSDDSTNFDDDADVDDAEEALEHLTGQGDNGGDDDDNISEINTIENVHGFEIEAVGINVGATALAALDDVEDGVIGPGGGGDADNITTAEELTDLLTLLAGGGGGPVAFDLATIVADGADEDVTFSWKTDTTPLEAQGLESGGTPLQYSFDGVTLIAHIGDPNTPIFTVTLSSDGTGTFTFSGPLDDTDGGDDSQVHIDFSEMVSAVDYDGDGAVFPEDAFCFKVPAGDPIEVTPFSGVTEEDALPNVPPQAAFTGNEDDEDAGGLDTDESTPIGTTVFGDFVLDGNVTGGDGTYVYSFLTPLDGTPVTEFGTGTPLTSRGQDVYFDVDDVDPSVLYGFVDNGGDVGEYNAGTDRLVFLFELDIAGGTPDDWSFDLYDNFDHDTPTSGGPATEENLVIDFSNLIQVDDQNGETAIINGAFTVIDDTPDVTVGPFNQNGLAQFWELDETTDPDNDDVLAEGLDTYGSGDLVHDDNGDLDDTTSEVADPTGTTPFGTVSHDNLGGIFSVTKLAGADGEKSDDRTLSLKLLAVGGAEIALGVGLLTTLEATQPAPGGNPDSDGVGGDFTPYADPDIYLFKEVDGTITGRVGNSASGPIAFRITLTTNDPATAQLKVDQFLAIDHPTTPDTFDEQLTLGLTDTSGTAGIALNLSVTLTDGDDDTDTDDHTALITNRFRFDDDGPRIVQANRTITANLELDESIVLPNTTGDESGTIAAGPDDQPGVTAVNGVNAIGVDTFAVADLISAVDFGQDGGTAAYSLLMRSSDGNGGSNVEPILKTDFFATHPAPGGNPDFNGGTDYEPYDASVDGGNIFLFQINPTTIEGYVGENLGAPAGPLALRITIDPSTGLLTIQQFLAIRHADTADHDEAVVGDSNLLEGVLAKLTATDGDGDQASLEIPVDVKLEDDGPTLTAVADLDILDDEEQDTLVNPGVDALGIDGGPGDNGALAVTTGTLAFDPGTDGLRKFEITGVTVGGGALQAILVNPTTGQGAPENVNVLWTQNPGDAGGTFTGTGMSGQSVFTLVVEADGDYTFSLFAPLVHSIEDNPDTVEVETEFEDNISLLFATRITDGDGDTATSTLTISVDDDTPDAAPAAIEVSSVPADPSVVGLLNFKPGADGWGPASLLGNTPPPGLESNGNPVKYWVSTDGMTLIGYIGADVPNGGAGPLLANQVFTLVVNPGIDSGAANDGIGGNYTFDLLQPIDAPTIQLQIVGGSSFGAGPEDFQILSTGASGSGQQLSVASGWHTDGTFNAATWLATGVSTGVTHADINGSTGGWGVDNNNFTTGEFMRFDFSSQPLENFDGAGGYVPPAVTLPDANQASFTFPFFAATDDISYVAFFSDGTRASATLADPTLGLVVNAPAGQTINHIEFYANSAGGSGKVDLGSVAAEVEGGDVNLSFNLALTDGDGDTENVALAVTVAAESPLMGVFSLESGSQTGLNNFNAGDGDILGIGSPSPTPPFGNVFMYLSENTIFGQDNNIDALHVLSDGRVLFSTESGIVSLSGPDITPNGAVGQTDIFLYDPSTDTVTLASSAEFDVNFSANTTFASALTIDALHVEDDGSIIFSSQSGPFTLPGAASFDNNDLVHWDGADADRLFDATDNANNDSDADGVRGLTGARLYNPAVAWNPAAPTQFGTLTITNVNNADLDDVHVLARNGSGIPTHFIVGFDADLTLSGNNSLINFPSNDQTKFNNTQLLEVRMDDAGNYWVNALPYFDSGLSGNDGDDLDAFALTVNDPPSDIRFTGNASLAASTNGDDTEIAGSTLFTLTGVDPDAASGLVYTFDGSATHGVNVDNGGAETFTMNSGTGVVTTTSLDYDNGVQTITITTPRVADPLGETRIETVTLRLGTNNNGDTIDGSATTNDQVIYGFGGNDTLTGGSGNDWIGGGADDDTITGGGGADIIEVGTGTNIVRFTAVGDFGDTLSNFDLDDGSFVTEDRIEFTAALNTLFDDITLDDNFQFNAANGAGDNSNQAVNLTTTIEALFLDGSASNGVANANLTNAALVAAEFNAEFAITAVNGDDALLVINDTDGNSASLWQYVESTGGGEISASEITLIAVVNSNAAIATGNLDLA